MIFTENWHLKWVSSWIHRCQIHSNVKYQLQSRFPMIPVVSLNLLRIHPPEKATPKSEAALCKTTRNSDFKKNPWSFHDRNVSSLILGISTIYLTIWIKFRLAQYKPEGWKTQQVKKCGFPHWNNEINCFKSWTAHFYLEFFLTWLLTLKRYFN